MTDSPKLAMAESYYAVAADLERNAREQLLIAERLNRYADMLCEKGMEERKSDQPGDAK